MEYKKVCLKINGKESVKLRDVSTKFKSYSKQLDVPFKIYAYFEHVLKGIQSDDKGSNVSYTKSYQNIFFQVLVTKLCMLMIDLASTLFFTKEKCSQ